MPDPELMGGSSPTGPHILVAEFFVTVTDGSVWLAIGLALLVGAVCLGVGIWLARIVGILEVGAPLGESVGVGLASGLMVGAAWWAAIWSRGQSSFTPVAIGFAVAIAIALVGRRRGAPSAPPFSSPADLDTLAVAPSPRPHGPRSFAVMGAASALFVIVIALLYGSTLAPSPRAGVQPVEFSDVAFYAVLGRDLADTGTETNLLPSGFSELPGVPRQTWYHWAELWLASAMIAIFGAAPLAARYFIVLPLVLLAAAALTGTLVRRFSGASSRRAFLFGSAVCLFLAPIPLAGPFFSSWAAGLMFGVTLYGLAAVAVLLALYGIAVIPRLRPTWSSTVFMGSAAAFVLPAHIVIAVLAVVGLTSAWAMHVGGDIVVRRRLPRLTRSWATVAACCALLAVVSGVWGIGTGHGLGGSQSLQTVAPFDGAWQRSIAYMYLGAGTLLAIPIVLLLYRAALPTVARLCVGVLVILGFGALVWGARLDDFNMFHVFFGGLAVFASPVAAIAAWTLHAGLRASGRALLAYGFATLCAAQLALGVASTTVRLQELGPRLHNEPIASSLLMAIRELPSDATLAYACRPFEEFSFVDSSLLSIDAHTSRRVVPVCFQADIFSNLNGSEIDPGVAAAGFEIAPQSVLFPNAEARPSVAEVTRFLEEHGIEYLYADVEHPNTLVPAAIVIAKSDRGTVLRLP